MVRRPLHVHITNSLFAKKNMAGEHDHLINLLWPKFKVIDIPLAIGNPKFAKYLIFMKQLLILFLY